MRTGINSTSQIMGDLISDLYSNESLDERFNTYANTVKRFGFDAVCYSFAPRSSLQPNLQYPPIFKFSSLFPLGFLDQYAKEELHQHDFTIREIQENKLDPKDWKEYENSGELSEQEVRVIKIAREDYGIKNALSIPTLNHSIGIAGASIISFEDDATFQKLKKKNINTLKYCTQVFNDIIMMQASPQLVETFLFSQLPRITPIENIVLRDLVSGIPIKAIGQSSNMAESTVANHLQRLRKKFKVSKTSDLKYLLESLNIMDYL